MNPAGSNSSTDFQRLYSQRNWPQLTRVAEDVIRLQPENAEAWRFSGIAEWMQFGGGHNRLLRSAQLNDFEAGLWLGALQEFAFHPRGTITVHDIPAQVDLAKLRLSRYMDFPKEVHIETFAYCNAKCSFCPYPTMTRQGDKMSDALINKIIEDLRQIPADLEFAIAPFKVNEPFLDKRIFDVCAKINERLPAVQLRLFTNGSPLTRDIIERIVSIGNVTHLWVSLNEVDAQAYQNLMQLPLDRTLQKLDVLHELIQEGNFPHPVVISRVADGSERDSAFGAFVQRRYPLFRAFLIGIGNWSGQVDVASGRRIPPVGCSRWYEISIMASGKVALCCMDGEGKHVIGDVNTQSVLEVYNSADYRKMRQFTFSRKSAAAPCDTCVYPP